MQESFDITQELSILNQYIPNGGIWNAKGYSQSEDQNNLRKLLYAIVSMFYKVKTYSKEISNQLNITNIDEYTIELWERLAGLPDDMFNTNPASLTLDKRISQVITKLTGMNIRTQEEVKKFIMLLHPWVTDVKFFNAATTNKFPIIFKYFRFGSDNFLKTLTLIEIIGDTGDSGFPYTFPFVFGHSTKEIELFLNNIIGFPFRYEFVK